MANAISDEMRRAVLAQASDEIAICLATLTSTELHEGVQRFAAHRENITSRGQVYAAYPFEVILASDVEGQPVSASLSFYDASGEITTWLDGLNAPPTVLLEVVRLSDPDRVEVRTPVLRFTVAETEAPDGRIGLDLGLDAHGRMAFPYLTFNPRDYPGMF